MKMTELIDRSVETDVTLLGENYIESTRPKTGHTPHFIDKLPLNYLYCGIIHAALPNAKIVLLERDPLDACFAIYKTMFIGIYPFSYDLKELGNYYLAYRRLVDHWQDVLGDALYRVTYEDVVENTEAEVRKLLEYCNLEWESQCIEFHNNPGTGHDRECSTGKAADIPVISWKMEILQGKTGTINQYPATERHSQ